MDYLIVLFKNKEKRKIINKFKTKKRAFDFFNKLEKESQEVIFEKRTENGVKCNFELTLMEKKGLNSDKIYIKDELGRTLKVDTDSNDYNIKKVINYKIEEEFLDYHTKKRINYPIFEKKYLGKSGVKLISKLNNKIILQYDETFKLFTFKDIDDTERFLNCLVDRMKSLNRIDCIIVSDYSFPQRKYLYELLVNHGFSKSYLQRYSTTFPSKK